MKNIPVITVSGKTLAETYESALINLYEKGTRFKTQYDKPGDPLSIDCTMNITKKSRNSMEFFERLLSTTEEVSQGGNAKMHECVNGGIREIDGDWL